MSDGWSAPTTVRAARVRARRATAATATAAAALVLAAVAAALGGGTSSADGPPPGAATTTAATTGRADTGALQPAVARSVRAAIAAAGDDGIELSVTSGWRSAARQGELYVEAVEKYGSAAAARQWVLPPQDSEHVTGGAVDVGPPVGAAWLRAHGVRFGLCQRYANEPWHFERLAGARGSDCPSSQAHP